MWKVNEIFYSIQGEGNWVGTPMNFIRLSGCNLKCKFCDTDHETGSDMDFEDIKHFLDSRARHVCITGGEPTLQDLDELCYQLKTKMLMKTHIETNGTSSLRGKGNHYDWVTVSPKSTGAMHPSWRLCDEVKFLCGSTVSPGWRDLIDAYYLQIKLPKLCYLQPIWTPSKTNNLKHVDEAMSFVLSNPGWRLSLQIHKMIGVR